MPDPAIVDLYDRGLAEGFLHPDGQPRILSNHRHQAMPPEMADQVKRHNRGLAEAITHHAEHNGYTFIKTSDLEQLRTQAAHTHNTGPHIAEVWCGRPECTLDHWLIQLAITTTGRVTIDGQQLITALHARQPQCPHPVIT